MLNGLFQEIYAESHSTDKYPSYKNYGYSTVFIKKRRKGTTKVAFNSMMGRNIQFSKSTKNQPANMALISASLCPFFFSSALHSLKSSLLSLLMSALPIALWMSLSRSCLNVSRATALLSPFLKYSVISISLFWLAKSAYKFKQLSLIYFLDIQVIFAINFNGSRLKFLIAKT